MQPEDCDLVLTPASGDDGVPTTSGDPAAFPLDAVLSYDGSTATCAFTVDDATAVYHFSVDGTVPGTSAPAPLGTRVTLTLNTTSLDAGDYVEARLWSENLDFNSLVSRAIRLGTPGVEPLNETFTWNGTDTFTVSIPADTPSSPTLQFQLRVLDNGESSFGVVGDTLTLSGISGVPGDYFEAQLFGFTDPEVEALPAELRGPNLDDQSAFAFLTVYFGDAFDNTGGPQEGVPPVTDDCDLELVPEDETCDLTLSPATARDIENPSTRGRITGTAGIASALTFGTGGAAQQVIGSATVGAVAGIVSAETFGVGGSASINTLLLGGNPGTGVVSGTRFGVGGSIQRGTGLLVLRGNSGITTGGFGATGRTRMYLAGSAGVVSGAAFGTNALVSRTVGIRGTAGIVSALTFGTGGKAVLDVTGTAGIPAGSFGTGGAVFRPGATLIDNHMLLSLTWQA